MDLQRIKRQHHAYEALRQAEFRESVEHFVDLHREELPKSYWLEQTKTETPSTEQVLGVLRLASAWGTNDFEYFDFVLPGEVSQYVLSVHFDEDGNIDAVSMDS